MKLFKLLTFSLILGLAACADQSSRSIESQLEAAGIGLQGGELVSKATDPVTKQVKSVLAMVQREGYKPRCGGVFISPNLVLTAGHCLFDVETNELIPAKEFKVSTCIDKNSKGCKWTSVKSYVVHEGYFKLHPELVREFKQLGHAHTPLRGSNNDLAIILLSRGAPIKEFIPLAISAPQVGDGLFVFGSGITKKNEPLDELMRVTTLTAEDSRNRTNDGEELQGRYLVVQSADKGICPGDSGAPVFFRQNENLFLSAINLMLMNPSSQHACGAEAGVVLNLSKYRDWIKDKALELTGEFREAVNRR